jgi:molybdate transport system substrate-binding protein
MRHAICILALSAAAIPLAAADLSMLATAAAQGPLQALEKQFQQPGHSINVQFDTSPNITKRLAAGEVPDVLVAQTATIDRLVQEGKAIAGTRAAIGKIGVGVAMGKGARRPDIGSADALKASLLQADAVVYSQGASGLIVEEMLRKIGVVDQIKSKVVQLPQGSDVMKRLGTGTGNQIGFTMVSEIKLGESFGGKLVGPLPAAIQTYTPYEAVVLSSSKSPDVARAYVRAIVTPAAREVFKSAGWEF